MQIDGQVDIKTVMEVVQAAFTGLMTLIAWFFRRTIKRLEEDIKKNDDQNKLIPKMETNLELLKKDVDFIRHEASYIRQISQDVAVLTRDQKSIWRNVDELRGMVLASGKKE